MLKNVTGKVFGDKGYLSQSLKDTLKTVGTDLITRVKKNMEAVPLSDEDTYLLGKRGLVETVIDQIKNQCHAQHTRHRADSGFTSNLMASLIAYCHQTKKPQLVFLPAEQTSNA